MYVYVYICLFAYIFKKESMQPESQNLVKIVIHGEGKEYDEEDRDGNETAVKVLYNV